MSDATVPPVLFAVRVLDLSHYLDEDQERTVGGFASLALAREYARRRTRDSLEEQRPAAKSDEDLRERWFSFGEDCLVNGDHYCGGHELDYFIAHPASAQERDWLSLAPPGCTSP